LKFYKLSLNSNNNKSTYKEFCGCLGIGLCSIWWFVFRILDPSILKGHNFLNFIPFCTIFSALIVPIGRVQVLFRRKKQWNPPLGYGLPWMFIIIIFQNKINMPCGNSFYCAMCQNLKPSLTIIMDDWRSIFQKNNLCPKNFIIPLVKF
jgi:hypothetical protein